MDDVLINFGGALKSLGGNRVGGHLVLFGDAESHDLDGDWFGPDTDFDIEPGDTRSGFFNHGLDVTFKNAKIGRGTLTKDEQGIYLEAELKVFDADKWTAEKKAEREEYIAAVMKLVDEGECGLSSGAVSHLVRRKKTGKSFKVTDWPIGEWSITHTPAEARTRVMAIKSWQNEQSAKAQGDVLAVEPQVKTASPLGDMTPDVCAAAFERLSSNLSRFVYQQLWGDSWGACCGPMGADDPDATPVDRDAIEQAGQQFLTTMMAVLDALLALPKADPMATKSFLAQFERPGATDVVATLSAMPIKTYLDAVGAVVSDSERRLAWYAEQREIKQGRPISAENLNTMQAIYDGLKQTHKGMAEHITSLDAMLKRHKEKPADKTNPTAQVAHEFARYLAIGAQGAGATINL